MKELLIIDNLKKQFGKKKVIKNVSFKVNEGSIFALLGPNGAGKSTIMNILSTLMEKSSGNIILNGNFLAKEKYLSKRLIGYVFQESILDNELTVYENLYLRGALYNISKKELKIIIENISKELKITKLLNEKYGNCSGGQKRIIMIARALLYEPKLLILDEPTVGLDPKTRNLVWETLIKLNKEKHLTIIFSTHYMEEISFADQICIISNGQVLFNKKQDAFKKTIRDKYLRIEEDKKTLSYSVKTSREALNILNEKYCKDIISFQFNNDSLDDVFIKLIKEGEIKNENI